VAIVKWNTPPGGDQEDRRAHIVGHGDNVKLQHTAFGDKVQGGGQVNADNPNYELATKWSTAPYRGPEVVDKPQPFRSPYGYRDPARAKKCMGSDDTCNAWAVNKYDGMYCNAHGRTKTED
jgi:hypothetical protein